MNKDQIREFLKSGDAATNVAYERNLNKKAWLCYPCDDHVIKVYKGSNGFWYGGLTTMRARDVMIEHSGPERTRAACVIAILTYALESA